MPSLIFLMPVFSSTMDPVARVVIETFLDDIFLADDENTFEEMLLLPARDADMDRTEAISSSSSSSARECNKKKESCCVVGDTTCNLKARACTNEDVEEEDVGRRRQKRG